MAISDVFDALTSTRPYKEPWSVEAAVNYIREYSGKHFDPQISGIFLDSLDSICAVREPYREPDKEIYPE